MKQIVVVVLVLMLNSCDWGKGSSYDPTKIQQELDEEFGKYEEEVKSEDKEYYQAYNQTLSLWNTPYHEVHVPTSHGKAHVIVSGPKSGEPLVLLHGMNASSTMWYPNVKALSQHYRVYAIDYLLEPGKSQMNKEIGDMDDLMNWYHEVFEGLKLEEFSLIGASEGGWLAVRNALRQESRVKRLILLSPLQTFIWIPPGLKMSHNITYSIAPKREDLRDVLSTMSTQVDEMEQAYIDQYFIATQIAEKRLLMFKMTPFSDDELKSLTMPILVLIGDQDIVNKEKSLENAKELLPKVETGTIKDAGHFLSMDQPKIVNKWMLEFLKANSIE
ncbi:alpha/beta hydrolase [Reichenbachiella agarivorans]|uniref:Alpha/beta hydrolase n=1 Tax=Reichenbachiella agarivorans TaxID=2979464 RepID=A0ABY6CJW7_9BACT|nr:alpha/beta hydrolase [Reichenbachiella agarivorans]UXP30817.1 alpha/beta hydrolase [Reichenbachiella agarivorans]